MGCQPELQISADQTGIKTVCIKNMTKYEPLQLLDQILCLDWLWPIMCIYVNYLAEGTSWRKEGVFTDLH